MLGGVKNLSVGICDGAPSIAHSSIEFIKLDAKSNRMLAMYFSIFRNQFKILNNTGALMLDPLCSKFARKYQH